MNSQPELLKHVFRFGRIACARDQKAEKLRTVRCVQGGKTGLRGVDELLPFTFFSRGVRRQKIRLGFSAGAVASCGGVSFAEDGPRAVDLQRPGELFLSKGYELGTAIVAAALFLPPPIMLDQMAIVPVLFQETAPVGHVPQEVPAIGSEGEATSANPVEAPTPPSSPEEGLPIDIGAEQQTVEHNDIVVTARPGHAPGDPLQAVNAQAFAITQTVDKAVVAPVAMTYQRALPGPVRGAIRNFFNNLAEPVAFLNFLVQLKPGKAAETAGRFAINTTVGVAGMIDVARKKPFKLPRRSNGFANTLGYYGVKPGPFLFLPLIGPTTVRDLIGLGIDRMVLPSAFGQPFNQPTYTVPASIVGSLDYRVQFDSQLRELKDTPDPYAASRRNYLEGRQAEIDALHGRTSPQPITRRTLPVFP
jgi:phospholipid-binding lipoprotein MlaA